MDAEYLEQNVGICLSQCLAEVCMKRPADPIEYIAHWLYKHIDNVNAKNQELSDIEELQRQRDEYAEQQEALERQKAEQERIAQEEDERKRAAEADAAAQAEAALATVKEREEPETAGEAGDEEEGEEEEGEEEGAVEAVTSTHSAITPVAEADEEEEETKDEEGD